MPLIPPGLRTNPSFRDDFRSMLRASPDLLDEIANAIHGSYGAGVVPDLVRDWGKKYGQKEIPAVIAVLSMMVSRAATEETTADDGLRELKTFSEELEDGAAEFVRIQDALRSALSVPSSFADIAVAEQIFGKRRTYLNTEFEPALALDEERGVFVGLRFTVHYHDTNGDHHAETFTMAAHEAEALESQLKSANEHVARLRADNVIRVANPLGEAD